jgi:accessory gene regulator protein AgrB
MSLKLSRVKLKLRVHEKTLKLVWVLKELRCEVESNVLDCIFCKGVLAHLRLHNFFEMELTFSVNILHGILFIALLYMCYLIFLRRLKRGTP